MINLFFNWYESKTRQTEIDFCLEQNKKVFDRVVTIIGDAWTFSNLFKLSEKYPDDINCFCNSDIYFKPETFHLLNTIKENECYVLSRWDIKNGHEVHFNRRDSFDSYIFRGAIKEIPDCDFTMGVAGCDDSIAERINRAGYVVKNPSMDIKTIHVHKGNNRTYDPKAPTPKPYLLINPHTLNETNIIRTYLKN